MFNIKELLAKYGLRDNQKENEKLMLNMLATTEEDWKERVKKREGYKSKVRELYKDQLGSAVRESTNLDEYFPVMGELDYIHNKTYREREGMAELLALQALFESTGGRSSNYNNLFGAKPGGEGNEGAKFEKLSDSVDYQLGEHVLGGGATENMNILADKKALDEEAIRRLYASYNPQGAYLETLISMFNNMRDK